MNFLEAAKSGKRFKRALQTNWHRPGPESVFKMSDILADDYEIEISQEISRSQFWSAVAKAQKSGDMETLPYRLAVNLGLE